MKKLIIVAGLVFAGLAASVAPARASTTSLPAFSQTTWSGYLGHGTYSSISAIWHVPTAYCGPDESQAAVWAGMGSVREVEQAGVALDCSGGHASYTSWIEFYPRPPMQVGTVSPGDRVGVAVWYKNGTWHAGFADYTKHYVRVVATRFSGEDTTAELITEASDGPLAPHSPARFYSVKVEQ